MKMKNIALSLLIGTATTIGAVGTVDASQPSISSQTSMSSQSYYKYCYTAQMINNKLYSDIYYMYSDNKGAYFLDPAVKYDNVIFMPYKRLLNWGIDTDHMYTGQTYTGVYNDDNWKVIKIKEQSHG